jgi:uncharacterized membrane protein YidH (DUF202 family)
VSGATPGVASAGRDPGLQGERTALSWNRTGLALGVNALLALRTGWVDGHIELTVIGVLLLLTAAAAVVYGNRRGRALSGHDGHHVPPAAPSGAVALVALATLLACAAGVTSVLVIR